MEIAIPLVALGGMFIIYNKKKEKENYSNMGMRTNINQSNVPLLPNTNTLSQNYPISNPQDEEKDIRYYPNPNQSTEKYFDQNAYEQTKEHEPGNTIPKFYSLTGNYMNTKEFKHNNMQPFYGAKIKGYTYDTNMAESILDNMTGSGSQLVKKIEQAPLFKPEENIQFAYGAPNNSDFYQSRVNPGVNNNNVKPFDSIHVGPGLNQGYGTEGTNGFNSGMEARDSWLPKTVDEMRVTTNPKLEYNLEGHQGPAQSNIKNIGIMGRMEKQRPDAFYIQESDRWFTTTGAVKGPMQHSQQELGIIKRNVDQTDYLGTPGIVERQAGIAPQNFEPSKREELPTCDIGPSNAIQCAPLHTFDLQQSFKNYENHRTTIQQPETFRSGFTSAVGAVVSPLLDLLKPTKKEEFVNSIRIYGETKTSVPKSYVVNPKDTPSTTLRETTQYFTPFQINNQRDSLYVNNYTPGHLTQRDTTQCSYIGTSGGNATQSGNMIYEADYNQRNNEIKSSTIQNRANQGGMQLFNPQMNVTFHKPENDCYNNHVNPPYSKLSILPPSTQTYGAVFTTKSQNCTDNERIDPSLLEAFKNNPYTHPLTSSV
jgi:hypothetical protein